MDRVRGSDYATLPSRHAELVQAPTGVIIFHRFQLVNAPRGPVVAKVSRQHVFNKPLLHCPVTQIAIKTERGRRGPLTLNMRPPPPFALI